MRSSMMASGLLAAMILISACGPKSMVILVPDPDGFTGNITVTNASGSVNIDKASQATIIKSQDSVPSEPVTISPKKIQAMFSEALAIQPPAPVHIILFFETNSTRLVPESFMLLNDISEIIQKQQAEHITVVGHCDTKGDKASNLELSMQRAILIKNQLIKKGIANTIIEVTSHGEENPIVKTADNVDNVMNRRVEIVIR
jgi:outer membrane protein OmpA-like peptidoglycan-associated protein